VLNHLKRLVQSLPQLLLGGQQRRAPREERKKKKREQKRVYRKAVFVLCVCVTKREIHLLFWMRRNTHTRTSTYGNLRIALDSCR
jgi:hypothetical protein